MPSTTILAALATFLTSVSAHGYVSGIVAGGKWYPGANPANQYANPKPAVAGWTASNLDNGFVSPDSYASPDIICHKSATPGQAYVTVAAGQNVQLQWTPWPDTHHGPVLDYLASCNGECTTVSKTALSWVKIDQGGLISGNNPGKWATDNLISTNNTWTVKIPSSVAPGNYVLRHEIIALHSAGSANGAQNYPQCVNLKVTGSGTTKPTGVAATSFYKSTDPGILFNIYSSFSSYTIPGPALWSGAGKKKVRSHARDVSVSAPESG